MHPLLAISALMISALPAALSAHDRAAREVALTDRYIRVRDLAALQPHERTAIGALIAASVPAGRQHLELSAERRAALLRRRVPGQTLRPLLGGVVRFVVSSDRTMTEDGRAGRECFALRQNLATGAYLANDALAPVACHHGPHPKLPLRYDRAAGAARVQAAAQVLLPGVPMDVRVMAQG